MIDPFNNYKIYHEEEGRGWNESSDAGGGLIGRAASIVLVVAYARYLSDSLERLLRASYWRIGVAYFLSIGGLG
jgi:hypothetical protein